MNTNKGKLLWTFDFSFFLMHVWLCCQNVIQLVLIHLIDLSTLFNYSAFIPLLYQQ